VTRASAVVLLRYCAHTPVRREAGRGRSNQVQHC
jgi:hypothetical protein